MKKEIHCTIGGVELLREEVEMTYSRKPYIVAYTGERTHRKGPVGRKRSLTMDASLYAVLSGAVGEAPTPYPPYRIQKAADGFEGMFGIRFSKVHDKLMSVVFRLVITDIFAFDDRLREKYGNHEEEGKSMRDIVTEHHGEKGMKMILNLIG